MNGTAARTNVIGIPASKRLKHKLRVVDSLVGWCLRLLLTRYTLFDELY